MSNTLYRTDSLHVAAYLNLKGMEYVGTEKGINHKRQEIVRFVYNDPDGKAVMYSAEYMTSDQKRYVDAWKFLRDEIYKSQGK